MLAGQKMINEENGKQVCLFPLTSMLISQGENVPGGSHVGTYSIDFNAWGPNGREYQAPIYAPCDMVCEGKDSFSTVRWNSLDVVNYADGTLDYLCMCFTHDDNYNSYNVGDVRLQGEIISHTGTAGIGTGDHTHIDCVKGHYAGGFWNSHHIYQLNNQYHMYDMTFINDTTIINDWGYPWKYYVPPIPPPPPIPLSVKYSFLLEPMKRRKI